MYFTSSSLPANPLKEEKQMANHGVSTSERATSVSTPVVADSGIPFVIGAAPIQSADNPADIGVPVLVTSWGEAQKKLGYSEDWGKYNLCEFMYSHFILYGCQPVIFCNLLNPATMKTAVSAADMPTDDHKVTLPMEAIDDETLVVSPSGGGTACVKGTDYAVYYSEGACVIETLEGGAIHTATSLNVAYSTVDTSNVNAAAIATGLEAIELCIGATGKVPDLIVAPGFSDTSTVAAVMATKASGIFGAKALVDISTEAAGGADDYGKVLALKSANNFTDANEIACWPMLALGGMEFHMSTQLAGLMASVDTLNSGCPYESPSSKGFKCDSLILKGGTVVRQTKAQADALESGGVVTGLAFTGGIVCWGNYTACYPANTDVKDYFIPVSRMFDWVGNTAILTFWGKLDKPMNRRLIDTIMDTVNIWINGLVGAGYLLGGRVEMLESENPTVDLMAGIMRLHIYMTPPSPAKEINFILEYDASYVATALQG